MIAMAAAGQTPAVRNQNGAGAGKDEKRTADCDLTDAVAGLLGARDAVNSS
jgi:hypothetical protein